MIQPEMDGHVCEASYLITRCFIPLLAAIIVIPLIYGVKEVVENPDERVFTIFSALILPSIGLSLLISTFRSKSLNMTYHCDRSSIENCSFGRIQSVDINVPFFISDLPLKCYFKGAVWYEHYIILSSSPFSPIPDLREQGGGIFNKLWEKGTVVLPADDDVKAWLCAVTGISSIPQYPKVAYVQRDDFWRSYE